VRKAEMVFAPSPAQRGRVGAGASSQRCCSGLIATDTSMGGLSTRRGDIDETET
jgi:hypothetical protein